MTIQAGISDRIHRPLAGRHFHTADRAAAASRISRVPSRRAIGAALRSPSILLRLVVLVGLAALALSASLDLTVLISA